MKEKERDHIATPSLTADGIFGLPLLDNLPGGQWAAMVKHLKEWLFLSDQLRSFLSTDEFSIAALSEMHMKNL